MSDTRSSRPMTSSTLPSKHGGSTNTGTSAREQTSGPDTTGDAFTRRAIIYTGPDGLRPHHTRPQDPMFVGLGDQSRENTTALSYMFRPAPGTKFPKAKNGRIGETGWEQETWNIQKA